MLFLHILRVLVFAVWSVNSHFKKAGNEVLRCKELFDILVEIPAFLQRVRRLKPLSDLHSKYVAVACTQLS